MWTVGPRMRFPRPIRSSAARRRRPEVWAYGLRNPWRFSFDRTTHDLYIADVGQNMWEEIDFWAAGSPAGRNYGWDVMEGMHCYEPMTGCVMSGLVPPVYEYSHGSNNALGCSITGGYVYRGTRYPALAGRYFFAELCEGWVRSLKMQGGVATDVVEHTEFGSVGGSRRSARMRAASCTSRKAAARSTASRRSSAGLAPSHRETGGDQQRPQPEAQEDASQDSACGVEIVRL